METHLVLLYAVLHTVVTDIGTAVAGRDLRGQHVALMERTPHVQVGPVLVVPANSRALRHRPVATWFPVIVLCDTTLVL